MILTLFPRYDESGSEVYAEDDDDDSEGSEEEAVRKCEGCVPFDFCFPMFLVCRALIFR